MRQKTIQSTIRWAVDEDRVLRQAAALDGVPVATYTREAALLRARARLRAWAEELVLTDDGGPTA